MQVKLKLVGFLASAEDLLRSVGVALPTSNLIVCDGRLADLQEKMKDGDLVELIPPIGGG
jgi:molybdopterin converting factor small subunit